MTKISRKDIHTINQYSNWSEEGVQKALKKHVFSDKESWQTFLRLFLISLGITFTVSGIIFFFAYNWDDLGKFTQFGLVEGLLIFTTIIAILPKIKSNIRNIVLTGSSMLVGVLFAIFGQIYQTGANAYDFFLAWTLFITVWAFVANFSVLSLVFLTLINTTFILYCIQVNTGWSFILVCLFLFILNSVILISFNLLKYNQVKVDYPNWLNNIIGLAALSCATVGVIAGVFGNETAYLVPLLGLMICLYSAGITYGLSEKKIFYLGAIPVSILIIIFSFFMDVFGFRSNAFAYLILSLLAIGSISGLIVVLVNLTKQWNSNLNSE